MTPYTRGAGYLLNNQELNVSQREEADIRTCTHCQKVVNLQQWKHKGAWCHRCFAPICVECGIRMQTHGCEPFMAKLEKYARQQMRYQKLPELVGTAAPTLVRNQ